VLPFSVQVPIGVAVGTVGVRVGVDVGTVGVMVGVSLGVGDGPNVGEFVGVGVRVRVGVIVGVLVRVRVGVRVQVGHGIHVLVTVEVCVAVCVDVAVAVAVEVGVAVGVGVWVVVGVSVGTKGSRVFVGASVSNTNVEEGMKLKVGVSVGAAVFVGVGVNTSTIHRRRSAEPIESGSGSRIGLEPSMAWVATAIPQNVMPHMIGIKARPTTTGLHPDRFFTGLALIGRVLSSISFLREDPRKNASRPTLLSGCRGQHLYSDLVPSLLKKIKDLSL
jgi:hypothetical protein